MNGSTRLNTERGFTLLEVLVALAILGLAVVTLIELSSQSLRLVKTSADYQDAVRLADRLAGDSQPTDEGVESGEEGSFQWERRVALVPMPDELKPKEVLPGQEPLKLFAVTIDVRWGRNQQIELATLRTPTSAPGSAETQQPSTTTPQSTTGQQPTTGPNTSRPATSQPGLGSQPSRTSPSTGFGPNTGIGR